MRRGFIFGFILSAGVASLLHGADEVEVAADGTVTPKGLVSQIRALVREAIAEGRQASDEREEELVREFEQAIHEPGPHEPPLYKPSYRPFRRS